MLHASPEAPITQNEEGMRCNEEIKEITDRIHQEIHSLYSTEGTAASSLRAFNEQNSARKDSKGQSGKAPPGRSLTKRGSKLGQADADSGEQSESLRQMGNAGEEETWDVHQSKATIKRLLGSLQTEQRADVVDRLSTWFSTKAKRANNDSLELTSMEAERSSNEEATKAATKKMEKELEHKEMDAVKTLNNFYRTLTDSGKKGRKQAAAKRSTAKRHFEAVSEYRPEEWRSVELTQGITNMREQLLKQEEEYRKSKDEDVRHDAKVAELLEVLTRQQDDVDALSNCVAHNEQRCKTLKVALEWTSGGSMAHEEPDEAVMDCIKEMRKAVRESKLAELTMHRKSLAEKMTTDGETTEEIDRDTEGMRVMVQQIEREMREIEEETAEATEKEIPKSLQIDELSEEKVEQVKQRLYKEAARMASEEQDLKEQCEKVEGLARRAHTAVRMMEAQKQEFIESVAEAKKNLLGEQPPTSEKDAGFPGMEAAKEADPDETYEVEREKEMLRQKEEEDLQRMREEESALKQEIDEIERAIAQTNLAAKASVDEQDDLRKEIVMAEAALDTETSKLGGQNVDTSPEHLDNLVKLNQDLLNEIEALRTQMREDAYQKRREDIAARQARSQLPGGDTSPTAPASGEASPTAPTTDALSKSRAGQSKSKESTDSRSPSPPGEDAESQDSSNLDTAGPEEPGQSETGIKEPHPPEAFYELLQVHESNLELLKEVEVIESRIQFLRGSPADKVNLDFFKDAMQKLDVEDTDEYKEMMEGIRVKQDQLMEIREQFAELKKEIEDRDKKAAKLEKKNKKRPNSAQRT